MLHHFAAFTGKSWAVAYHSPTLGRVALNDGYTEQGANSEAARLNAESAARHHRPAPARQGVRRSVRYFEPDQFA